MDTESARATPSVSAVRVPGSAGTAAASTDNEDAGCCERRGRSERRDSIRNRAALIDAASVRFSRDGLTASLEGVAQDAGVGIGTLYRHFPTRLALWEAVLAPPLRVHIEIVERGLGQTDPWEGFAGWLLESTALQAQPGGWPTLLTTRFDGAPELIGLRRTIQRGVAELFARAQAAGAIRADAVAEDLAFVSLGTARVIEALGPVAPDAWRRNVELFLAGLRAEGARPLDAPPLKPSQVYRGLMSRGATRA